MNIIVRRVLRTSRNLHRAWTGWKEPSYIESHFYHQEASDAIKSELLKSGPSMICRFGRNELMCAVSYYHQHEPGSFFAKAAKYIRTEISEFWWEKTLQDAIYNNAGVFPKSLKTIERFAERMLEDVRHIDILGVWRREEKTLHHLFPQATRVPFLNLEPYRHQDPWSAALAGVRVLVVHPFSQSIDSQYRKRALLFKNPRVLPEFELTTLTSVQSIAGNRPGGFADWFEALDSMCEQVRKSNFDIALIGCGAYGLPLAAFVKKLGKKAIHLGGATQVLFGIKGRRWDQDPEIVNLYNEHWIRPSISEMPPNHQRVEEGCYW